MGMKVIGDLDRAGKMFVRNAPDQRGDSAFLRFFSQGFCGSTTIGRRARISGTVSVVTYCK